MKRTRPVRACPVCGSLVLVSNLAGHVAGRRCLKAHAIAGKYHDPTRGPRAARLAAAMAILLGEVATRRRVTS